MLDINFAEKTDLERIAECHAIAFPKTLSTKLGKKYLIKMYEWYLSNPARFLFYTYSNGNCTGFCGGVFHSGTAQYGSSSSMAQHTLPTAIIGILYRPWILFHNDILYKFPFIAKNLLRKAFNLFNSKKLISNEIVYKNPYAGLVVIGVLPEFRGKGHASLLIEQFEKTVKANHFQVMRLSVLKTNSSAIRTYTKNNWLITGSIRNLYIFEKKLDTVK